MHSTWKWRYHPIYEIWHFEIPDLIVLTKSDLNNLAELTFADLSRVSYIFKIKMNGILVL